MNKEDNTSNENKNNKVKKLPYENFRDCIVCSYPKTSKQIKCSECDLDFTREYTNSEILNYAVMYGGFNKF
jgi:hypothetical protein